MKVLVTGSKGFIGKAVQKTLEASGHEMVPYDLPDHDITDSNGLNACLRWHEPEAIINLAGMLGTPELFGHEAAAAKTNILGALNVYDQAALWGIPVVQIGTGHKGQPNPYAITKACAEDLGLCRAQFCGEKITIVRAYHVYGPGQAVGPPHGTASVHKFFPTFATRALTGMNLELCGGGKQAIDPVYVDDVAEVLVAAIYGPYGEVMEAGCGAPVSVARVAQDIGTAAMQQLATETGAPTIGGGNITRWFLMVTAAQRDGEPLDDFIVARRPECINPWPYKVPETVEWYAQWLQDHS